ncbi:MULTISPECIES: GntR family transcriptional regulator [unclassified Leifsonia]|uniref:GntR family transcriptional regulator n=1 Tax=unclassified Leifsonia TaxID=2663824 RepID=UPI000A5B2595
MIAIAIDAASPVPPFEQIRTQVIAAVRSGDLVAGERMPTVRALAERLGLAVNTVAKAYRALESDAVIETRGRAGTLVSASGDVTHQHAQTAAAAYAARVGELGIDADEALALVEAALRSR